MLQMCLLHLQLKNIVHGYGNKWINQTEAAATWLSHRSPLFFTWLVYFFFFTLQLKTMSKTG